MKFKYSVENFRGIAIIFVMLSHFESLQTTDNFGIYLHFFFGDATTWFVFISGYLFGHIEFNQFNAKKYLIKKLKFVIFPYIVLSIPAISIGVYYSRPELYGLTEFKYIIWSLITGGQIATPMWFIPMIVILFLFSLIICKIKNNLTIYAVTVVFLALSIFSGRPFANFNPVLSSLHFFGFYLLGLTASIASNKIKEMSMNLSIFIVSIGIFIFLLAAGFHHETTFTLSFFTSIGTLNTIQFGKLGLLISIFFILEKFLNTPNKLLSYLANISFGLFFIHGFSMAIFKKLSQHIFFHGFFAKFIIEFLIVIVFSMLVTIICKNIFKEKSRYVIGC